MHAYFLMKYQYENMVSRHIGLEKLFIDQKGFDSILKQVILFFSYSKLISKSFQNVFQQTFFILKKFLVQCVKSIKHHWNESQRHVAAYYKICSC